MLELKEIFSFRRVNLYINAFVLIFLIVFLRPNHNEYTIKNKDFHTHCIKTETTIHETDINHIDLDNVNVHSHVLNPSVTYEMRGHSHDLDNIDEASPMNVVNYDPNNVYETKYDRHLEYILRGFVVVSVLISAVVINKLLLTQD